LPSHTYLESWGDDVPEPGVGFSVGAVSQPVVSPLYNTRAVGDIILGVAQALGFGSAIPWPDMEAYLQARWREIHERSPSETQTFEEFWTAVLRAGVWGENTRRAPGFFAPDSSIIESIGVMEPEFSGESDEYPFILHPYLSSSLHDGRGANLPWMQELPDPLTRVVYGSWVELNPATAEELGFVEGDVIDVESPHGRISAPVYVYPAIRPDVVAMPIGQGHSEYGRYARNRGANPIQILSPVIEPVTGSLASSATRVRLSPTGRRVRLLQTGGTSRQLGRGIVQTAGTAGNAGETARLNNIPITVVQA
jgi:anaerobic selenocysteine-containing dehydrogenase